MPFGRGAVNEEGIAHYNDLINECLKYDIIPLATLYHWDMPLMLQDSYGGWLSENIVNDFVEYARVCYGRFGDRVKYWITVNTSRLSISRTSISSSTAVRMYYWHTLKHITLARE